MIFWDTSALIPLIVDQEYSTQMQALLKSDKQMVVWWGCLVESHSALHRLQWDQVLAADAFDKSIQLLCILQNSWTEILPGNEMRAQATRAISLHGLKTLDALQLAAALMGVNNRPAGMRFATLDRQLGKAAAREGFSVLPLR